MARSGQAGVALITVMVIVAIVVSIAGGLLRGHQLDIRRAENVLHGDQAIMHMLALETWARELLLQDREDSSTDHGGEAWAQVLPPVEADGGVVAGRIVDQQGLFNLNNLLDSGRRGDPATMAAFQRLLEAVGEFDDPTAVVEALVDWMDPDQDMTGLGGSEDPDYAILDPAYRTPGRELASPTELLLVEGISYEEWLRLRPFVTVLPGGAARKTPLNVNTAPATVLQGLAGIDESVAADIVAEREEEPFEDVAAFRAKLASSVSAEALEQIDFALFDTSSDFFLVESEARFGDVALSMRHLLERGGEQTRVLVRSLADDW